MSRSELQPGNMPSIMASNQNTNTSFAASTYSTGITTEKSAEDQKGLAELIAFTELIEFQHQFDDIELEQQRNKEHALRPLYAERQKIISRMSMFWPTIFLNPPPEIAQYMLAADIDLLTHLTSFQVERFEINDAGTSGDPRSLRITFEFAPNDIIEDKKLVKELRYRHAKKGGRKGLVSDPVSIKWKIKQKDLTRGMGPCAVSLFEAEKTLRSQTKGEEVDAISRRRLWQNERVLQGLRTMEGIGQKHLGFFALFYYRGIDLAATSSSGDDGEDGADGDRRDNGLRDVEICSYGSDLANFLAEHIWEDVLDHYLEARKPPESELDSETREVLDHELSRIRSKIHFVDASSEDHYKGPFDGEVHHKDLDGELSGSGSKSQATSASGEDPGKGSSDGEESCEDLDGELSGSGSQSHAASASGEDPGKGSSDGEEAREELDGELLGSGCKTDAASARGKNPRKRYFEGEESSDDGSDISGKSLNPFKPKKRYWRF